MRIALITLSYEGARVAEALQDHFPGADMFIHECVDFAPRGKKFARITELTAELFDEYDGLVYVAPCGVVVRAVAPNLIHKAQDPAVVVVDVCGRYAISLLSGHEGGANELALAVANAISAEPVVTTTTEARKHLIVGIGCRRGTTAEAIVMAVKTAVDEAHADLSDVRLLASADIKADEEGLIEAARMLGAPLRFIASEEILTSAKEFQHSDFVEAKVRLPAVAEPSALLAGRRTRLVLKKTKFPGVTVAIAQESCLW
jgi:cobalt-precorrin 5A hydrolase